MKKTYWETSRAGTATFWMTRFVGIEPTALRGCTDADLQQLQASTNFPLPAAYVQVLREIGRSEFLTELASAHFFFPDILRIPNILDEVLDGTEWKNWRARGLFPIWCWEVDDIHLLDLTLPADDAPVFYLDTYNRTLDRAYDSFSEYFAVQTVALASLFFKGG